MEVQEHRKRTLLFLILGSFFLCNAILAEFIGVKIFSLEGTLGIQQFKIPIFGIEQSMDLTAGVLPWPIVFIMTDIINEYYGKKGVRTFTYIAVALISYAFVIIYSVISLSPADWWEMTHPKDGSTYDTQKAFATIFGQGLNIIVASLTAFVIAQFVDVFSFHLMKKKTGDRLLWLRATGSTLISQIIDSFIVLYVAFYLGGNWTMQQVLSVGANNYIYKFVVAIALTPLLYVVHYIVDSYLGKELSEKMRKEAQQQ